MLGDASEAVRFVAARRLAERGEQGAKSVLRQMVSKGSSEAVTALVLLNRLGEKSEQPQLGAVAQAALPVEKRMQLVESVQNLDPSIALPLLMQAARDPEPSGASIGRRSGFRPSWIDAEEHARYSGAAGACQ
jgi:hypothetical protein